MRTKFLARTAFGQPRGLTPFLIGLISLFSGAVSAAIVTSTWNGATAGNWDVDARWTNVPLMGGFPNNGNGGVATYAALSQNSSQTDQALGNYVLNLHAQVIPEPSALGLLLVLVLEMHRNEVLVLERETERGRRTRTRTRTRAQSP